MSKERMVYEGGLSRASQQAKPKSGLTKAQEQKLLSDFKNGKSTRGHSKAELDQMMRDKGYVKKINETKTGVGWALITKPSGVKKNTTAKAPSGVKRASGPKAPSGYEPPPPPPVYYEPSPSGYELPPPSLPDVNPPIYIQPNSPAPPPPVYYEPSPSGYELPPPPPVYYEPSPSGYELPPPPPVYVEPPTPVYEPPPPTTYIAPSPSGVSRCLLKPENTPGDAFTWKVYGDAIQLDTSESPVTAFGSSVNTSCMCDAVYSLEKYGNQDTPDAILIFQNASPTSRLVIGLSSNQGDLPKKQSYWPQGMDYSFQFVNKEATPYMGADNLTGPYPHLPSNTYKMVYNKSDSKMYWYINNVEVKSRSVPAPEQGYAFQYRPVDMSAEPFTIVNLHFGSSILNNDSFRNQNPNLTASVGGYKKNRKTRKNCKKNKKTRKNCKKNKKSRTRSRR